VSRGARSVAWGGWRGDRRLEIPLPTQTSGVKATKSASLWAREVKPAT